MPATRPAEDAAESSTSAKRARTEDSRGAQVTEEETALYDRQIRLWGLEAQNRMRKSHILVYNLQGIATEIVKNIVLSGVGTLTIVDEKNVSEEGLSSGFFFREEEVGTLRVDSALPRIQALNPLVKINKITDASVLGNEEKLRAMALDVLVTTAGTKADLLKWNAVCRKTDVKFYAARAQGLGAWMFADLGPSLDYIVERTDPTASAAAGGQPVKKKFKYAQKFVTIEDALTKSWKGFNERQVKRLKLSPALFATWAAWDNPDGSPEDLEKSALSIAEEHGVPQSVLAEDSNPAEFYRKFHAATRPDQEIGDFAPTCAVMGGLLSQSILNALGGREEPITNWLQLDSMKGHATIYNLNADLEPDEGVD